MRSITKDYQLSKNKFGSDEVYPLSQMNLWTCCLYILPEDIEKRRYQSG